MKFKETEILANLDEEAEELTEEEHVYCKNGGVLRGEVVKGCLASHKQAQEIQENLDNTQWLPHR